MTKENTGVFVSGVLGRPVVSLSGTPLGKLCDLSLSPGEPFPAVAAIHVRKGPKYYTLPFVDVVMFNQFAISVSDAPGALKSEDGLPEDDILVARDILDKQIVDIDGARVVRVNDLKLERFKDLMCLISVDTGVRGLSRRLGQERLWSRAAALFGRELPQNEIGWQFVQPLNRNLSNLALTLTRDKLKDMHPADLAEIIAQLPHQDVPAVLGSLNMETAGEALSELHPEISTRVLNALDSEHASDILEEMPPDEAADLLADLPEEKAQELLGLMDADDAEKVQELMEHEEDTAGGLMTNEFIALCPDSTTQYAINAVRLYGSDVEMVYYLYVLDEEGFLLGVASLRDVLTVPPDVMITDIMTCNVKTVELDASPEDVMEVVAKYNLMAVPVLDEEGKMAGVITADDILEKFLPFALKWRRFMASRNF